MGCGDEWTVSESRTSRHESAVASNYMAKVTGLRGWVMGGIEAVSG